MIWAEASIHPLLPIIFNNTTPLTKFRMDPIIPYLMVCPALIIFLLLFFDEANLLLKLS